MRIDSRKPKAAALSAALTVALLVGAGATDAHAATLSDTVGSTPSETTLVQPVDYRGDGYGSMQEWNASMEAKRDSLEMRAQIIMNMYGDYATDDERAVLQGCIDGAGSLLTMGEVDARSTELDELRTALEDAKCEALEAAAAEAEAAEVAQASYYNAGYNPSYASAASYANGSGLTRSAGVNNYNGRRETYYSSNVLYHYRTGEWTQDSEGFWRDADGYYVVAASDKSQGSTFTGSKGECKVYDSGYASFMSSPYGTTVGTNYHKDILKAWTPENKGSDIPRLQYGDQYTTSVSDRFLTDASYLNISNINVGYTLPSKITQKFGVQKLRVYLACDNVVYWSKRQGLDPRYSFTGATNFSNYSPIRTISGGVTVQF